MMALAPRLTGLPADTERRLTASADLIGRAEELCRRFNARLDELRRLLDGEEGDGDDQPDSGRP